MRKLLMILIAVLVLILIILGAYLMSRYQENFDEAESGGRRLASPQVSGEFRLKFEEILWNPLGWFKKLFSPTSYSVQEEEKEEEKN